MKFPQPTLVDKFLTSVAPNFAVRRYNAKLAFWRSGTYAGARSDRAALKAWKTGLGSADADSLGDLNMLRSRSRDLLRNNPIAVGARATARSHTIGAGLKVRSRIDRELLGLTPEAADQWERYAEKLFHVWANSTLADVTRTQNFYQLQSLVFNTTLESGDAFVLRQRPTMTTAVPLAVLVVEADRVATPLQLQTDADIRAGVRVDQYGAPISYFFSEAHPADDLYDAYDAFREIPAYGAESGERLVLHVFDRLRPELTRGIPFLAPVIETLKQLDRYTEAELMSAVISSFFTVFLKTDANEGIASATDPLAGMAANEITLGPGTIIDVGKDEDIDIAQSSRPNSNFPEFYEAVVRQIGIALSIPYELLIQNFTASYSASRAALEMAAQFFRERREWVVSVFCQPVYEWFLSDAIGAGLISAPGFTDNPIRRAAWCGTQWIGPRRMILDPLKEWKADTEAVNLGGKTLEAVVLETSGEGWEAVTDQRGIEHKKRAALGLDPEKLAPPGQKPTDTVDDDDEKDEESDDESTPKGKAAPKERESRKKPGSIDDGRRRDNRGKFA